MLTSSSVKQSIANLALSNLLRPSVAALAKTLANEYAGHGIRVNQVVPGRIATDRVREIDELNSKKRGVSVEEQRKLSLASIPMARYGDPDEFGRAVAFLLSDAASYITGATLQVDGGMIQTLSLRAGGIALIWENAFRVVCDLYFRRSGLKPRPPE